MGIHPCKQFKAELIMDSSIGKTNLYKEIIKLIDKLNFVLNTAYSSRISPELIIEVGNFQYLRIIRSCIWVYQQ